MLKIRPFLGFALAVSRFMGLSPGAGTEVDGGSNGWEPMRKRIKEQDLLENSQISSVDFLHTGSVSTGLGLSLDDRRIAASSGESQLLLLPTFDEDIDREMQRMDAEIDQFIKLEVNMFNSLLLCVYYFFNPSRADSYSSLFS